MCLDPLDGSARWDVPVGRWPRAIHIAGGRCLVLPQDHNRLVCVALDTGEDLWRVDLPPFTGHLVVAGETVLVGGWRGYTPLRALDLATGRPLWETGGPVHTVLPVAVDGGFLIGAPGSSSVRLVDERGERSAWVLPHPLADHDHRPAFTAVGRGRFVVRCGGRAVVELVPSTGTVRELLVADGRVLRRVDIRQPLVGHVVPVGTRVVLAGAAGTLFQLDFDGQITARANVTRRIRALRRLDTGRVLAITKGTLLAATVDAP